MQPNTIIAFDLYGTLLSTSSIAKDLAAHFGQEKAASLAALWRRYQLEYTWRLNSMSTLISSLLSPFYLFSKLSYLSKYIASSANKPQKTNSNLSPTSLATLSTTL